MSKVIVTDTYLTNIANAIRAKNGTQNTYTPAQMATAISNIPSGGSGWTTTLLSSKDVTDSFTGTSAVSFDSITSILPASLYSDNKFLIVKIRDKAGKRKGYFYGSDNFFYVYKSNASTYASTMMRIIYRVNTSGFVLTYVSTSATGYGVYANSYTTSTGNIGIYHRYSSSNSLTIDGTYAIECYSISTGETIWNAIT